MSVVLLTTFVLIAFAANTLLCRMALGADLIDPMSFTALRLVSGALILIPVSRLVEEPGASKEVKGSWGSGFALFSYAATYSLAYVSLNTGMGALILFGAVQVTMIAAAMKSGDRLSSRQWGGTFAALGGLIYLVFPGISAPDPIGAFLMSVAGIAWGVYSIRGKGVLAPVAMTSGNFSRSALFAIAAAAFALSTYRFSAAGILLALTSGIVTSGLGYVLWYRALRYLSTTQASVVQLLVPVLAAFAGVVFLAEQLSARLILASALILGGVALAVVKRRAPSGRS